MAMMLGIRLLVTSGLAGAAVAVAHQSTKVTKEKLYKWVGDKFRRRSPDPAAPFPNSGVNKSDDAVKGGTAPEPSPSDADQLPPHNTINGDLTAEKADLCPRESDPVPSTVNAVPFQGAREPEVPSPSNAVKGELTCEAPDLDRSNPAKLALTAVQGQPADEPPRSEALNLSSPAISAVQGESTAVAVPPRSEVANLSREAPEQVQGEPVAGPPRSEFVNPSPEAPDPEGATGVPSQPALPAVEGEPAVIYSTKKKKKKKKNKKAEPATEPSRSEALNLSREAPEPVVVTVPPALSSVQGEPVAVPPRSEVVNPSREAPDPAGATGARSLTSPSAVQGEPAAEPPGSEAVKLTWEAPDPVPRPDADPPFKAMPPDPPPATGVWALTKPRATDVWADVKDIVPGLWAWTMKDPDPPPVTGVWARIKARTTDVWAVVKDLWARAMKDPDLRYRFLHIPKAVLLVFVDHQFRRLLKDHKFWMEAYNKIFKFELGKLFTFF